MITVTLDVSENERFVWKFGIHQHGVDRVIIRLNYYYHETRASKRHKFKPLVRYEWIDKWASNIAIDDVPLPDHVVEEARRQLTVEITR